MQDSKRQVEPIETVIEFKGRIVTTIIETNMHYYICEFGSVSTPTRESGMCNYVQVQLNSSLQTTSENGNQENETKLPETFK